MGIELELQNFVTKIDQDYLIGLSNKGTVKRAEKDLENITPVFTVTEDDICMEISDIQCHFVMPVENFTCSCPSRNICRHLVSGLLYLMKHPDVLGNREEIEKLNEEKLIEPLPEQASEREEKEKKKEKQKQEDITKNRSKKIQQEDSNDKDEVLNEIRNISLEQLKKAVGKRKFEAFLYQAGQGYQPQIRKTSIYTIQFQEDEITVKLLSPISSSSCTCHKKTLCAHKALAILYLQLQEGILSLDKIKEETKEEYQEDIEGRKIAGQKIKDLLTAFVKTGMSRQGENFTDSCYQMALFCHNCRLPVQEREFRSFGEEFRRYQKHSSEFQMEKFVYRLHRFYEYGQILLEGNAEKVQEIAGEFKASYYDQKSLVLYGVGQQPFLSESGYEGITTWFLSVPTMKWYSFTRSMPRFYDGAERRKRHLEKEAAPWNLGCATEMLAGLELLLENPKVSQDDRLSSSESTKGYIIQAHEIFDYDLPDYYRDFKIMVEQALFAERRLVFVEASRADAQEYDTIRQCYRRTLYDEKGRSLKVELKYSAVNKKNIEILEYYGKKEECPIYFGKLYVQDGALKLEPIEVFQGRLAQYQPKAEKKEVTTPFELCMEMKVLLSEAEQALEYMILSGFSGFYQTMEEMMKEQGKKLSEAGLTKAGAAFEKLTKLAKEQRDQVGKKYDLVFEQWNQCYQWLIRCKKRLEREMVLSRLTQEEAQKERGI